MNQRVPLLVTSDLSDSWKLGLAVERKGSETGKGEGSGGARGGRSLVSWEGRVRGSPGSGSYCQGILSGSGLANIVMTVAAGQYLVWIILLRGLALGIYAVYCLSLVNSKL